MFADGGSGRPNGKSESERSEKCFAASEPYFSIVPAFDI